MKKIILILAVTLAIGGCASTTLESKTFKSYELGRTKTATIGESFLIDQTGEVRKIRHWVGLLNSEDGWKVTEVTSADYIRKELIYSGKSASTIKVSYREYRGGYAAPAFFQNLEYDLNESKTIKFQRFTIDVLEATNQAFTYRIIKD